MIRMGNRRKKGRVTFIDFSKVVMVSAKKTNWRYEVQIIFEDNKSKVYDRCTYKQAAVKSLNNLLERLGVI